MKLFRALSFLRKPFGKPFGQLRVVSLSNRLTALSLSKGQESKDEDGFRVVPGMTICFSRR
jgi:hypothetical protein